MKKLLFLLFFLPAVAGAQTQYLEVSKKLTDKIKSDTTIKVKKTKSGKDAVEKAVLFKHLDKFIGETITFRPQGEIAAVRRYSSGLASTPLLFPLLGPEHIYFILPETFALQHDEALKQGRMIFNARQTLTGEWVCSLNSYSAFSEAFNNVTVTIVELTQDNFPKPLDQ